MFAYPSLFDLTERSARVVDARSGIGQVSAFGLAAYGVRVFCAGICLAGAAGTAADVRAQDGEAEALSVAIIDTKRIAQGLVSMGQWMSWCLWLPSS